MHNIVVVAIIYSILYLIITYFWNVNLANPGTFITAFSGTLKAPHFFAYQPTLNEAYLFANKSAVNEGKQQQIVEV